MDDVRTVMDAVGSDRAALVGHGHAGQLCMLVAASHPDRVQALVTVNGAEAAMGCQAALMISTPGWS